MAPIKECGKCLMLIHASARECMYCGEKFQFDTTPNIVGKASTLDVLAAKAPVKIEPTEMAFSIHSKAGKPDSLRVDYYSGPLRIATEWVCLFHDGIAQARARQWWQQHVGTGQWCRISMKR
jgi:DNA repair protein RadD